MIYKKIKSAMRWAALLLVVGGFFAVTLFHK
jgi:hypothetical protein